MTLNLKWQNFIIDRHCLDNLDCVIHYDPGQESYSLVELSTKLDLNFRVKSYILVY